MYFSWLGGLAMQVKAWMNHHQFIHRGSHKFAAPVCPACQHTHPLLGVSATGVTKKNPPLLQGGLSQGLLYPLK